MIEVKKSFKNPLYEIVKTLLVGLLIALGVNYIVRSNDPFIVQYVFGVATYHWILKPVFFAKKKEEKIN